MADNDFDRTGDSLNRIIDDAIRSGNYGSLNSDINREVNRFTDDLVGGIFGTISKTTEAFTGGSRNNGAFEGGNRPSDRTSSWGRASGSYMKPIPPDNVNTYLFRGELFALFYKSRNSDTLIILGSMIDDCKKSLSPVNKKSTWA